MEIAIATVEFWESVGLNVSGCRKSVDGSLAMVHIEIATKFAPKIRERAEATIYMWPSSEFAALDNSSEWAGGDNGNA